MSSRRHRKNSKKAKSNSKKAKKGESNSPDRQELSLGKWADQKRPVWRSFDGPQGTAIHLRISFGKDAYADIAVHAKGSLDAEICGVLVGEVCEDNEGLFVSVTAAIRGKDAQQEKAHVTFTQETWNTIHDEKDKKYPELQIVGWYHSHPGFGVEISEMDRFIHENFFSSKTQFALITDPLGGKVAVFVNTDEGIQDIDRFWVNGREHRGCRPGKETPLLQPGDSSASHAMSQAIERVDTRLGQVIQALDDLQNSFFRFLMTIGFVVCLCVVIAVVFHIYNSYKSRVKPPELRRYVPVPVQIGDRTVMLGVGVVEWEVPPELNATYLQIEQMKREALAKAAAAKAEADKAAAEQLAKKQSAPSEKDVNNAHRLPNEPREPEK